MQSIRSTFFAISLVVSSAGFATAGDGSPIQFDVPAIATAVDTSPIGGSREVTMEFALSTLVSDHEQPKIGSTPPIDHLLVRIRMRDRSGVTDYAPKTELQSDFSGPISVIKKHEQAGSVGFSADTAVHLFGAANFGVDDSTKKSDSAQYERQAPMQAVIASGTSDRGRGVYFKMRWTTQQVLEGEKRFRVSFAVPERWRGGLIEVDVTANGIDRSLFGSEKLKRVSQRTFVVAAFQDGDSEAAALAERLAELDHRLAEYAREHAADSKSGIEDLWNRIVPSGSTEDLRSTGRWYQGVISERLDPYTDRTIRTLPMPVRVAVIGYAKAAQRLEELSGAG